MKGVDGIANGGMERVKIDNQDLSGFLEHVHLFAMATFQKNNYFHPMAYVGDMEKKDYYLMMCPEQFDEDGKDSFSEAIKLVAKEKSANFVVFLAESWMVSGELGAAFQQRDQGKYPDVASFPGAIEVLCYSVETYQNVYFGFSEIIVVNGVKTVEPPYFIEPHGGEGRFANFLPKPTGSKYGYQ